MKKILALFWLNYCFVFFAVSVSAQDFQVVRDGIEHARLTRKIKDEPVVINLLRLDLSKVRLDVVHAMDAAIGTETTSSIAARHGAIAAINAGFFRLDKSIFAGDAVGVLKIDGKFLSESFGNRVALFIDNKGNRSVTNILPLNIDVSLTIGKQTFEVSGFNRQRKDNELIIYTPEFNRTTLTNPNGLEIIVQNKKITKFTDKTGSSVIPTDGFVISVAGTLCEKILPVLKLKQKTSLSFLLKNSSNPPSTPIEPSIYPFLQAEDIIGGVPQLIKNGVIEITWEQEKSSKAFVETRHPRTAVAKLKDGKFLMATVDGRQPNVSVGMNLHELAEMLLELGATDAMNLDGGGSTTMFLGGKIVNQPSDKEGERKVSDAILVSPRKKKN